MQKPAAPRGAPTDRISIARESVTEWRKALFRVAAWRAYVGMNMSDEELARHARAEFERVDSPFYGYQSWTNVVDAHDGSSSYRVVVASPDGASALKHAPTDAEALGSALAEHLRGKQRYRSRPQGS